MTHVLVGPYDSGSKWRLHDSNGNERATYNTEPELWEIIEGIGDYYMDLTDQATIYQFVAEVVDKTHVKRQPGNEPWNGGPPL